MNGTSGYEEAAGQGLVAGINAALSAENKPGFTLDRDEAYIGVLIDDLVTKGTNEPYRLLTSRAEYRLLLRNDNADLRLTEKGHDLGLIDDERYAKFVEKRAAIEATLKKMHEIKIHPTDEVQEYLASINQDKLNASVTAADFLKRPRVTFEAIEKIVGEPLADDRYVKEQVEIAIKYEGYIKKEQKLVERLHRLESKKIPEGIDYSAISSLATEARQKFEKIRPESIAQAERISGVNPADLAILTAYIQQGKIAKLPGYRPEDK